MNEVRQGANSCPSPDANGDMIAMPPRIAFVLPICERRRSQLPISLDNRSEICCNTHSRKLGGAGKAGANGDVIRSLLGDRFVLPICERRRWQKGT